MGSKFSECEETRRKKKQQLENSIVSLTEENRDIISLLRVALGEKEAIEKSLSRMKGSRAEERGNLTDCGERIAEGWIWIYHGRDSGRVTLRSA